MRRGFKAEAERVADRLRGQLGLRDDEPIDPARLAKHLGVEIIPGDRLVPRTDLEALERLQPGVFSAATFHLADGRRVITYSPCQDAPRTVSNLAHELAHLLLKHDVREIHAVGDQTFLTCDADQESEANWLGGCLLLPRALLLAAARSGQTPEGIAQATGVSVSMANFRLNTSGVLMQARRGGSSTAARSRI